MYVADSDVSPVLFYRHLREQLPEIVIPQWYRRVTELPLSANRKLLHQQAVFG